MAESENLVLDHLRAMRKDIGELKRKATDAELRMTAMERHLAALVTTNVRLASKFDDHETRI
jgi:hypothetical protein